MKNLSVNWITEGWIDFEYKKYLLLDYLQKVGKQFEHKKLYPTLSDIIFHYHNLKQLKENKEIVAQSFPKQITKIDFDTFKLQYEKLMVENKSIEELDTILDFAIPQLQLRMNDGKELYAAVENDLQIFPIGLIPVNTEFGYLFLANTGVKQTKVFEYQINLFENSTEQYRGIKVEYLCSYSRSISNTYENMKSSIIKSAKKMAVPGTFVIECHKKFPLHETYLPVAKRMLVRYLYNLSK